jgi:hypothetical protein
MNRREAGMPFSRLGQSLTAAASAVDFFAVSAHFSQKLLALELSS